MNPFYVITKMVTQPSFHTSMDREINTSQGIQQPVMCVCIPDTRDYDKAMNKIDIYPIFIESVT